MTVKMLNFWKMISLSSIPLKQRSKLVNDSMFVQLNNFILKKLLSLFDRRDKHKKCLYLHQCVSVYMNIWLCIRMRCPCKCMRARACMCVSVCQFVCLSVNGPRHYWYKHCCIRVDKTVHNWFTKRTKISEKKWYNLKVQFSHRHFDDSKLHSFNI